MYYRTRAEFNRRKGPDVVQAARFLYLNSIGFNGVWRINKKSEYNVPYGKTSGKLRSLEDLREFAGAVKGSDLRVTDYRGVIEEAYDGDVVFADPPYAETFSAYTTEGFGRQDHVDLAEALRRANERGARVLATNADIPEIRALYGWARMYTVGEKRSVSQDGAGRVPADCLIIASEGWEL